MDCGSNYKIKGWNKVRYLDIANNNKGQGRCPVESTVASKFQINHTKYDVPAGGVPLGCLDKVCPVCFACILLKRFISSGFICTLPLNPTFRAALRMKDVRFEYRDSWIDAARDGIRVTGTPEIIACCANSKRRLSNRLITVAFMANLIQSNGKNQTMF